MCQSRSCAGCRRNDAVFPAIESRMVDPVNERDGVVRHRQGLVLDLECRGVENDLGSRGEVPLQCPFSVICGQRWIVKFSGAFHDHIRPIIPPADLGRIPSFSQDGHGNAVDKKGSLLFVHDLNDPFRLDAVQETVDRSVGGILFDRLCNCGKPVSHVAAYVDDDLLKIFSSDMVPQRQLADSPEAVDAEHRPPVFKDLDSAHTDISFVFMMPPRTVPIAVARIPSSLFGSVRQSCHEPVTDEISVPAGSRSRAAPSLRDTRSTRRLRSRCA